MKMKIKSVLLLFVMFLVVVTVANVSFAATDIVKTDNYGGGSVEVNFKGSGYDLRLKTFYKEDGFSGKNSKAYYTFTTKKKNYKIKSISVKYYRHDPADNTTITKTKLYNFKNKKSVTIKVPKYHNKVPGYYSYYYAEKFTVKYSNNKKNVFSKFHSTKYFLSTNYYTGKKTTITHLYKIKPTKRNFTRFSHYDFMWGGYPKNVKYTIEANKKTAKIKEISMELVYYDSKSGENKYKTIQINGKGKNTVVKNIPFEYHFISAKVTY